MPSSTSPSECYWTVRDQKELDRLKNKTPEQLLIILENYIQSLTMDLEPDLAIMLLRKHLGIKFNIPGTTTHEELTRGGCPPEEILEVKV